jgi:heme exporter protein B
MTARIWSIIQKDMHAECRAARSWPIMLLMGVVVALILGFQLDRLSENAAELVGGILWLAVFFAGTVAMEHSFASEREDGCWETLRAYPLSPSAIFVAKLIVNFVALSALHLVLVPLFIVLCDVPLLVHPLALLVVVLLANLGIAAVGTLLSALANTLSRGSSLFVLLALPALIPVLLAAARATTLLVDGHFGSEWWLWIQLLAGFAVIFIVAGSVLFEFVIEE